VAGNGDSNGGDGASPLMRKAVQRVSAHGDVALTLPGHEPQPTRSLLKRLGLAVLLVLVITAVVWLGRDGYVDDHRETLRVSDAFYYATVSATTTGYGDITPVTRTARLVTALVVTPLRVLFLFLLVGTAMEVLTDRWRKTVGEARWRRKVDDHYIIAGWSGLGRTAAETLTDAGVEPEKIVVIEPEEPLADEANAAGFVVVRGEATRVASLERAGVRSAAAVIVATHRDDSAVLTTLTVRELNPDANVVAAAHERENLHLLREGGASTAITAADIPGRMLALSIGEPRIVPLLQDILTLGSGLQVSEHEVTADEAGCHPMQIEQLLTIAVARGEEMIRFDDPRVRSLEEGDMLLGIRSTLGEDEEPEPQSMEELRRNLEA
jgi:voltage-gated potassium channel